MPQLRTVRRHERPTAVAPADRPETYDHAGARCRGCGCVLSRFNPYDRCWPCSPRGRKIIQAGARENRDDVKALQSLMEET